MSRYIDDNENELPAPATLREWIDDAESLAQEVRDEKAFLESVCDGDEEDEFDLGGEG